MSFFVLYYYSVVFFLCVLFFFIASRILSGRNRLENNFFQLEKVPVLQMANAGATSLNMQNSVIDRVCDLNLNKIQFDPSRN